MLRYKSVACGLAVVLVVSLSLYAADRGADPVEQRIADLETEIDDLQSQVNRLEAGQAALQAQLFRNQPAPGFTDRPPPLPNAVPQQFNGITYYTMPLGRIVEVDVSGR